MYSCQKRVCANIILSALIKIADFFTSILSHKRQSLRANHVCSNSWVAYLQIRGKMYANERVHQRKELDIKILQECTSLDFVPHLFLNLAKIILISFIFTISNEAIFFPRGREDGGFMQKCS